VISTN